MRKKMWLFAILFIMFVGIKTVNAKTICEYIFFENKPFSTEQVEVSLRIEVYGDEYTVYKNNEILEDVSTSSIIEDGKCNSSMYFVDFSGNGVYGNYDRIQPFSLPNSKSVMLLLKKSIIKKVNCGNITEIPEKIPELTSLAVSMVQVAVPVILVIMGTIDLFKGLTAQKEDEIKKGQQVFIKRLIVAGLIFFVVVLVKLFTGVVADTSGNDISECIDCFISNDCN